MGAREQLRTVHAFPPLRISQSQRVVPRSGSPGWKPYAASLFVVPPRSAAGEGWDEDGVRSPNPVDLYHGPLPCVLLLPRRRHVDEVCYRTSPIEFFASAAFCVWWRWANAGGSRRGKVGNLFFHKRLHCAK